MDSKPRQALGRGLSALIKEPITDIHTARDKNADKLVGGVAEIDVAQVHPNPYQPRTNFTKEALDELAQSIKELGVIQPITVRKKGQNEYEIISGERRWRASQLAGLTKIPAYVRLADDQNMLELALVENIQREDLDSIEVALSYNRLIEEIDLTQEQLSQRVGKKRSTVTNYLRLLKLPALIQAGLRDRMLSMGHARSLVNIEDEELQLELYKDIVSKELSVRQVEERVKKLKEEKNTSAPKATPLDETVGVMIDVLSNKLKTPVQITKTEKGKGRIIINFKNEKEFERLINLINN